MKRALRYAALMGVLGFAAWVGSDKPAFAIQYCEYQNGTPCYTPRATQACLFFDGSEGSCFCGKDFASGTYRWTCTV
jgi:hypothetical protein